MCEVVRWRVRGCVRVVFPRVRGVRLRVPLHLLFSVCGDEEGDFFERLFATIKNGTFLERTSEAFQPNNSWGPARIKEKTDWQIHCEECDVNYWLPKFIRKFSVLNMNLT